MTYEAVKEKLFWYIEHADKSKVMAIYTLLNREIETGVEYDEDTLAELQKRRHEVMSGNATTFTLKETMDHLKEHRGKHGI